MTNLPIGMIVLMIVSALIFLGLAHRVLDRMKLSDKGALLVILGLIVGSFITIPLIRGNIAVSVNVGGALIPLGLVIYLVVTAGTTKERVRGLVGAVVTALAIWGVGSLLQGGFAVEPGGRFGFIDTLWLYPLIAGIVGYLTGRSRRSSFISASLGVLLFDLGYYVWLLRQGAPAGRVDIGGAGMFDAIVFSAIFAVLLAEVVGEIRERIAGGPSRKGKNKDLLQALRKPGVDIANQDLSNPQREEENKKHE